MITEEVREFIAKANESKLAEYKKVNSQVKTELVKLANPDAGEWQKITPLLYGRDLKNGGYEIAEIIYE